MAWLTTHPSLLSRVRDPQDRCAWHEFDCQYGELILRYCRARGVQQSDAEDIRQIVMFNLISAMKGFRYSPERGRFRSYLGRVVANAITRHRTRPKGSVAALCTDMLLDIAEADDRHDDALWEQEWVHYHYRRAMKRVRDAHDHRSVQVFDRLLAGGSVRQVAAAFEMSEQAVHKVKQRIRRRLQALIAEQIEHEDRVHESPFTPENSETDGSRST